jgi:hypothetical protein
MYNGLIITTTEKRVLHNAVRKFHRAFFANYEAYKRPFDLSFGFNRMDIIMD